MHKLTKAVIPGTLLLALSIGLVAADPLGGQDAGQEKSGRTRDESSRGRDAGGTRQRPGDAAIEFARASVRDGYNRILDSRFDAARINVR